jgi:integrase/recombinase XerD
LLYVMDSSEPCMLRDIVQKRYKRHGHPRLHQEFEDFAAWLEAARYSVKSLSIHLQRLNRTLAQIPNAAGRATYNVAQLQTAFGKGHSASLKSYRATQHVYQRFLLSQGRLEVTPTEDRFALLRDRYSRHMLELRNFEHSTVQGHNSTITDFLATGLASRRSLRSLRPVDVERYVVLRSHKTTRRTLQNIVTHLRAFFRYCHDGGDIPSRLDAIDLPRVYRDELPPRALDWAMVQALLRSIDRKSKAGWRDYAILHLMAHYGLRPAEIIALRLDSIDSDAKTMRVGQCKTRSTVIVPLARQTIMVLHRYLDQERGQQVKDYPELFLRTPCPRVALKSAAITQLFQKRVQQSRLKITNHTVYSLRHSFAMRLLKRGVGVKAIGDLMGHRDLRSTCMYLRLDTEMLRGVALPVPQLDRLTRKNHA